MPWAILRRTPPPPQPPRAEPAEPAEPAFHWQPPPPPAAQPAVFCPPPPPVAHLNLNSWRTKGLQRVYPSVHHCLSRCLQAIIIILLCTRTSSGCQGTSWNPCFLSFFVLRCPGIATQVTPSSQCGFPMPSMGSSYGPERRG